MSFSRGAWVCLLVLTFALPSRAADADKFFERAQQAEKEGDDITAFLLYMQARARDPSNGSFVQAAESVRSRAAQTLAALGNLGAARQLDPASPFFAKPATGDETLSVIPAKPARRLKPPVELQPKDQTSSFRLRGSMREVYQQVAEVFGLNVSFDLEFGGDDEIRFDLDDASFREAIHALIDVTGTMVVPVHSKLFLVAEDTQENRNQLEPVATAVIPITEPMNAQDADELAKAVQQTLDIKRLFVDSVRQQVLVRDTVRNVQLADALYRHLAYPRAEVVVDVDLITLADLSETTAGITIPTSFPITNFSTILNAVAPNMDSAVPLLGIGGGKTVFGIAIASASLVAQQMKSTGHVFTGFSVRSTDGMPASFLVGERFPIINARFSAAFSTDEIDDSIEDGTYIEPFPSFTFEDLGLSFEMTPRIHSGQEVSLEIKLEVKQLTGVAVNDIPVLSNRTMQTSARLRSGEVALISGLAVLEKAHTRSGMAFLSRIPWLGDLLQHHFIRGSKDDLIIAIRPRVVRLPAGEMEPSITLRVGPEQRPLPAI
ncbi:MAG TPA: type II and III secretion system protein [Bryobacterales bacterium]|nr:type II and III secretion system protein [Bryobacterales bacterium]